MRKRFLLAFLVGLLGVATAAVAAASPDPPGLDRAIAAQERHTSALMAIEGVVGTAVGLGANSAVVLVFTEEAGIAGIPTELDGVAVRTKVTGKIVALNRPPHDHPTDDDDAEDPKPDLSPADRWPRPVPIGISTGHPSVTAGTIGARVTDGTNVYALSNNHIYANKNRATIGDAVIQPGTFDGGSSPADDIGTLFDFETIKFDGSDNTIDAAIALSSTANLGNATPADGYGTPKSKTMAASLNLKVKKYGRTTKLTKGQVFAINATVNVGYGSGVARFVGQIIITPGTFSAGGDSGSLIVVDVKGRNKSDGRKPVGLLFAGSPSITVANPIDPVLTRFGVTVDVE